MTSFLFTFKTSQNTGCPSSLFTARQMSSLSPVPPMQVSWTSRVSREKESLLSSSFKKSSSADSTLNIPPFLNSVVFQNMNNSYLAKKECFTSLEKTRGANLSKLYFILCSSSRGTSSSILRHSNNSFPKLYNYYTLAINLCGS